MGEIWTSRRVMGPSLYILMMQPYNFWTNQNGFQPNYVINFSWFLGLKHAKRAAKGHYITNPNNALLWTNHSKQHHTFALFDSPNMGKLMTSGISHRDTNFPSNSFTSMENSWMCGPILRGTRFIDFSHICFSGILKKKHLKYGGDHKNIT